MKLSMDSIQFESCSEIGEIIHVLEEWQSEHGQNDTIQEMIDKLDVMSMNW